MMSSEPLLREKVKKKNWGNVYTILDSLSCPQFSYELEMKTREQNRNNKGTEIELFDWFIERIQTRVAFGWLSERSREKPSCPRFSRNQPILRFDVILQHDWPIELCVLHIRVFFGGKTKRPCFDLFIHWQIKQMTNTCRNHFSRSYENRSHGTELEQVAPTHLTCTGAVGRETLVNYPNPHSWILRSKSYPVLLSFSTNTA